MPHQDAYLDHAASTPMRPEAFEAMVPWLRDLPANPSGAHRLARDARRAIDDAREVMAAALGCDPGEVVFTGGGTEADNLAVMGVHDRRGGSLVCSATEHHAVLEPTIARGGGIARVDERGVVDLDALSALIDDGVTLVSVMLANNEVGTIQPIAAVSDLVRSAPVTGHGNANVRGNGNGQRQGERPTFHTDAVQAMTWLDVAALGAGADLVSVSAHKFGGPKGVGVLVVRGDTPLAPRQVGGGQERERRSGTQNVAGIVAMARAAGLAVESRVATVERVGRLRDRLADGLLEAIPGAVETGVSGGDRSGRVAGACHLCIPGVESEALLFLLEEVGISASAGASCASGAMEPSHVLAAMGVPRDRAFGSLRLSLGWCTTAAEIDHALREIPTAVGRLRSFSPQGIGIRE